MIDPLDYLEPGVREDTADGLNALQRLMHLLTTAESSTITTAITTGGILLSTAISLKRIADILQHSNGGTPDA